MTALDERPAPIEGFGVGQLVALVEEGSDARDRVILDVRACVEHPEDSHHGQYRLSGPAGGSWADAPPWTCHRAVTARQAAPAPARAANAVTAAQWGLQAEGRSS